MGRSSVAEPSTVSPSSSHDPHGNQLPPNGDGLVVSPSAMASREIFQGLFKDLGKQAMAMESILRLVCGKVDKLESWVTEMSFGMTELDLKLRNIAHNIEGTAANVDDVPAANRWGVPQEEDDTPIATVVKKVGVAANKKKQMRMTGTVANILDQLTTVTEMPTAAESETESHASDKRKPKSKAKKAKATSDTVSSQLALSAATTPRAAEAKVKTKTSKTKIPKHPTKIMEVPVEVVTKVAVEEHNEKSVIYGTAVVAENLKSASEQAEKERRQEKDAVVAQESTMEHVRLNEKETAEHTVEIAKLGSDHIEEMTEIAVEHVLRNATVHLEPADVMPAAAVEPLPPSIHAVQIASPDDPLQSEDSTKARRNLSDESISVSVEQPPHEMNHVKGEEPSEPKQIDADSTTEMVRREVARSIPIHPITDAAPATSNDVENPFTIPHHGVKTQPGAVEVVTKPNLVDGLGSDVSPSEQARQPPLEDAVVLTPAATLHAQTPQQVHQPAALTKSLSNSSRREVSNATDENVHMPSLSKKGSRQSSIRKAITQRQPSIRRKQTPEQTSSAIEDDKKPREPVTRERGPVALEPIGKTPPVTRSREVAIPATPITSTSVVVATEIADSSEDDDNDNDDEDEDSSPLSSDSDESVLDLNEPPPKSSTNSASTPVEKRMTVKMTRAFTALKNLTEADVLSPEEVAELKQRTTQKWFRVRDHVKDKSKKDVANIMLKRKKNIFTVSNRIELLEDKSREVYASIKQVNMDLKCKLDMSTFDGLRRHVHDIHASLQVLDDRIAKGNTPAMDYIKQIAKDSEAMRAFFLEQLQVTREHCDGNHVETIALFDEQWQRVLAIEKSIQDKVAALVTEYDDKLHDLPDYTEALEGIRRAIRKKADSKALRELEARVLGHDADSEDCLVRCLSCHKEVVNAGHDPSQPLDDNDAATVGSPHFKRVNPGTAAARVYRSNVPLNAQPLGMSDAITEILGLSGLEEAASSVASAAPSNSKPFNPSRRVTRSDDPRPSPLSLIHVTASRAISTGSEANRPISAPASVLKKKAPAQSSAKQ